MHSILAPSSAHRWRYCTGSVMMELSAPPEEESEEARNGTAAHWVGQKLIQMQPIPQYAPNGVFIDDEMRDAAELYAADAVAMTIACGRNEIAFVEVQVAIPQVHEQCWGTPDLVMLDVPNCVLYIWDFKYGHKPVDAERNWQLACYAAHYLGNTQHIITDVVFRIVQPRCYGHPPIKEWRVNRSTIEPMVWELHNAAKAALSEHAKLVPSVDHCEDCRTRHNCPALQFVSFGATDRAFSPVPLDLPAAALGRELVALTNAADLLNARLDGLQQQAERLIRSGQRVPGWSMASNAGKLKWTVPDADIINIAYMMGMDIRKPAQAITPTQAKKVLPEEVVKAYSDRPNGSLKLVQTTGWKE